jgi:hypothetical protein
MNPFLAQKHAGPRVSHLVIANLLEYPHCHCMSEETAYVCLGEPTLFSQRCKWDGLRLAGDGHELGNVELLDEV